MESRRIELKQQFDAAMPDILYYNKISGPGIYRKFLRLLKYRSRYVSAILARSGIWERDVLIETFWGRKAKLPLQDAETMRLYLLGALSEEEHKLTKFILNELSNDSVFYDVGANFGFYSALACELVQNGEVHAFEPSEFVFSYLRNFVDGLNVTLTKQALANRSGVLDFFERVNGSGANSLQSDIAEETDGKFVRHSVQATTIDLYTKTHALPTLVKLDVEGAEKEVLLGGEAFFKSHAPVITLEVWAGEKGAEYSMEAPRLLKRWGYQSFTINDDGSLAPIPEINPQNLAHGAYNFVFKKV